jgi:hypothetical protein
MSSSPLLEALISYSGLSPYLFVTFLTLPGPDTLFWALWLSVSPIWDGHLPCSPPPVQEGKVKKREIFRLKGSELTLKRDVK